MLGWVPTLDEVYQRVRLFVAPLRYGAGMKGKVGEALAHGLPVVTTPIGAEGIGLRHGDDVLIAEDAEGLARSIIDAYQHPKMWTCLSTQGRESISLRYSPSSVRSWLADTLAELGVRDIVL